MEKNIKMVHEAIISFCLDTIKEPLCFFSEGDLQGFLFTKLLNQFPKKVATKIPLGFKSKGTYKTGLVHREYGVGDRGRMDIVIFSKDDVRGIDSPNLQKNLASKNGKKKKPEYLTPRFGFELGTEKSVSGQQFKQHFKRAIHKLCKMPKAPRRGYLIYFLRKVPAMVSIEKILKEKNIQMSKFWSFF